ncbi:MAG: protein translocase subunit SecD [Rickettsiaceae bacterium H1]|nr:protein translocase subunit SecD [Rickettsiaceae bacterium H1]
MHLHYRFIISIIILVSAICLSLPNFFDNKFLPNYKINFGLDLYGGSSLLLKIDFNKYLQEKLDLLITDSVNRLKKIGVSDLKNNGENLSVKLAENTKISEFKKEIKNINDEFIVRCTKNNTCTINFIDLRKLKHKVLSDSISIIQNRIDELGTREVLVQSEGDEKIIIQVPGLENPEQLKSLLGKTAKLTFHLLNDKKNAMILKDKEGRQYPIKRRIELTGELLKDASVRFNKFGFPAVLFKFNNVGAKKFARITKENVGKPFAIILDNQVLTIPVIKESILGGQGEISGNFTLEEAQELAILLRSGALPTSLEIVEERIVGPGLGADAISAGIKAAVISMLIISLFIVSVYGKLGLCAAIGLFINMVIMTAFLTLIKATLTLPGIAGIVLTIGMAVDANVLIFERIKEELQNAKNFEIAISRGFNNAIRTIFDSNITTLIAALIMFFIGFGPVKGFAVTLSIGILSSMLSAVVITREIMRLFIKKIPTG